MTDTEAGSAYNACRSPQRKPAMTRITHPYFGTLDNHAFHECSLCWEKRLGETTLSLWSDPDYPLVAAALDTVAALLHHLPSLDRRTRIALQQHLSQDDGYITYHRATHPDAHYPQTPAAFTAALHLQNLGIWYLTDAPDAIIHLDYMIAPQHNDETLVASLNSKGTVTRITWES